VPVVATGGINTWVVEHVPCAISSVCYYFLGRSRTITREVIGSRQYSADLPQGGLKHLVNSPFLVEEICFLKCRNFPQKPSKKDYLNIQKKYMYTHQNENSLNFPSDWDIAFTENRWSNESVIE